MNTSSRNESSRLWFVKKLFLLKKNSLKDCLQERRCAFKSVNSNKNESVAWLFFFPIQTNGCRPITVLITHCSSQEMTSKNLCEHVQSDQAKCIRVSVWSVEITHLNSGVIFAASRRVKGDSHFYALKTGQNLLGELPQILPLHPLEFLEQMSQTHRS